MHDVRETDAGLLAGRSCTLMIMPLVQDLKRKKERILAAGNEWKVHEHA